MDSYCGFCSRVESSVGIPEFETESDDMWYKLSLVNLFRFLIDLPSRFCPLLLFELDFQNLR